MKPIQAEIEFFCHPDQAWLQEEWEPAVGDWFLWVEHRDTGAAPEHVCVMSEIEEPQEIDELDGEVYWLPTLSDLLGMILDTKPTMWLEMQTKYTTSRFWQIRPFKTDWRKPTDWVRGEEPTISAAELLKKVRDASRDN